MYLLEPVLDLAPVWKKEVYGGWTTHGSEQRGGSVIACVSLLWLWLWHFHASLHIILWNMRGNPKVTGIDLLRMRAF
jgi:hypothetical protein